MKNSKLILEAVSSLYERIVNSDLLVRKINVTVNHLVDEKDIQVKEEYAQLDFFTDYAAIQKKNEQQEKVLEKEKHIQHAMLDIKKKFGKNAILKGMNLSEGATSKDCNAQIGGHKA